MANKRDDRVFPRHNKRLRLRYRESGMAWHRAFSADVAVTGVFVVCDQVPSRGADLELEADIPDGTTISLRGHSVRGKRVKRGLQQLVKGGFAIELDRARLPEAWYKFLLTLEH